VGTSVPPPGHIAQPLYEPPLSEPPSPRASRPRPKLIAAGVALIAVAGLVFLLFGSTGGQLGGPIAQAATLSSNTPGYRMRMVVELTSSALSAPITATGSGVVDLRDRASSMSLVMNLAGEPQAIQALGASTMRMDMISVGAAVYVKLPPALSGALSPSGKQWIEVDVAKLSRIPGLSSLASNPTTSDPSHILQTLRSVSDSVVDEGRQRIDGFVTTHYRAQLSLSHLADGLPQSARSAADQALATLRQAVPTGALPLDVWIDAHHLVRRVLMSLDLNLPTGPSLQETVTVDLSHYGPQTPPAAPPSNDVVQIA
jgi:hypothetical protein